MHSRSVLKSRARGRPVAHRSWVLVWFSRRYVGFDATKYSSRRGLACAFSQNDASIHRMRRLVRSVSSKLLFDQSHFSFGPQQLQEIVVIENAQHTVRPVQCLTFVLF